MTKELKMTHEIKSVMTGDDMINLLGTLEYLQGKFMSEIITLDERTRIEWVNDVFEYIEEMESDNDFLDILNSELGYSVALKSAVRSKIITAGKALDYIIEVI